MSWFFDSPSNYTVAAAAIPRISIAAPDHSRYALFPAFEPLSFSGEGSGIDPDAFLLPGDRAPLNEFMPSYPAVTALARFALRCDYSGLTNLSVSFVSARPWLRHNDVTTGGLDGTQCLKGAMSLQHAIPELGLSQHWEAGSRDTNVGAGNIFFADLPNASSGIYPVKAERRFANPALAWVDARLAFARDPEAGSAFGGAFTTSQSAELPVRSGVPALVLVRGSLLDQDGRALASSTDGYRWLPLSPSTARLRCVGTCVVALQGNPPLGLRLDPATNPIAAVPFSQYAPFLLSASVRPGPAAMLRYNVTYDRFWTAFALGAPAPEHVRIDAATNGWELRSRERLSTVFIVDVAAALECIAMLVAMTCASILVWNVTRESARAKHP